MKSPLRSAADLDAGQLLVVLGNGAVVSLALAVVVQPLQHFLDLGGHGKGCAHGVCAVQSVVQVLDVQVDLEAGLVVAFDMDSSGWSSSR